MTFVSCGVSLLFFKSHFYMVDGFRQVVQGFRTPRAKRAFGTETMLHCSQSEVRSHRSREDTKARIAITLVPYAAAPTQVERVSGIYGKTC